jgi:CheY-like chemotaxis protein
VWQTQDALMTVLRGQMEQRRVLVVEDDDAIRLMLVTVLEIDEYDVRSVRNGIDALAMLGEWRPDVIVLDLFMPVMDGQQFLHERSSMRGLASIPVVVVTASTASLPPAHRLGVRSVLQKPHDVNHLRALIAEAIRDPRGESPGGLYWL